MKVKKRNNVEAQVYRMSHRTISNLQPHANMDYIVNSIVNHNFI